MTYAGSSGGTIMSERVSIIVPCYNGERYVDRCLNSILNQEYSNIEVIVINDGSIDNSEVKIKKYIKLFNNKGYELIYVKKENGGVGSAIKCGLDRVKGEFFMLLDIDDFIFENAVKEMVSFLQEKNYKIVRSNGYYVNEVDIDEIQGEFIVNKDEKINEDIFEDIIYYKTNNWAGSYMVRTEEYMDITKSIDYYESKHGQNLQILLPMTYKNKCGFIDKPLMKYIKNSGSYTDVKSFEETINMYENFKNIRVEILKRMNINNKEYYKNLELMYLKTCLGLCLKYNKKNYSRKVFNKIKSIGKLEKTDFIVYMLTKYKFMYRVYSNLKGEFI